MPDDIETIATLIPGYDPWADSGTSTFDPEEATTAVAFFSECLKFTEGERAGTPFELEPWQQAIVANLFGWKRENGTRRYREAFVYVPRKNGKSCLLAGLVLHEMFCGGEPGAQLYSAASEREQAALIYRHAAQMVAQEPELSVRCVCKPSMKVIERTDGAWCMYKALSADAFTKHGLSPSFVVVDELHAHPNRELVDVLLTGTGARRQPLIVYITTADYHRESICNEKYDYACRVRDGLHSDPAFLPVVYEATADDDWKSPDTWRKANPNFGVSVSEEYLQRECEKAQAIPAYENTFRRLHLNQRTETDVRWLPMDAWDECGTASTVDEMESRLSGRMCWGALDLSTKVDITAWVLVFPPQDDGDKWAVLPRFFVPSANATKREHRDRVPYALWERQGYLTYTEGNVVDYEFVKAQVLDDARRFDIQQIAFDPWNATQIALQLSDSGANTIEFGQGYKSMSEPAKELEKLVLSRQIEHGGNPVLRWMASNVSIDIDPAGNVKPSKKKSTERIDGIVALVMGLGVAMVGDQQSWYQPGGLSL